MRRRQRPTRGLSRQERERKRKNNLNFSKLHVTCDNRTSNKNKKDISVRLCACVSVCLCVFEDALKTQRRFKPFKCHPPADLCYYQNWLESLDSHFVLKMKLEESAIRQQYRTPGMAINLHTDLKKQPTKKFLLSMYHLTTD